MTVDVGVGVDVEGIGGGRSEAVVATEGAG